jgi:HAD superfamily hydrolase (TIGR01459 family)
MPNSHGETVRLPAGLSEVASGLSLVICDLWGVMHDGIRLERGAVAAISEARAAGLETVFLSNAPRPRTYVREHLLSMGLPAPLADKVVTSGGLARDEVREDYAGARLYHLGPESDRNTVLGLPVEEVAHPDEAEVILATDLDFSDIEAHRHWLQRAAEKGVPFLCANPDRMVHVGEKLYACAGAVADLYSEMGGEVHWFGKPTAKALRSCLKEAAMPQDTPGERIIMIGDSLQTDMAGAKAAGYRGLFITGGIHRGEAPVLAAAARDGHVSVAAFRKIFGAEKAVPHAAMDRLVW